MTPYLHVVTPYLDRYGYWAVFFGVLLEDFGIPVPGETLLIAGSVFAALGEFHIVWIFLLAFLGAVLGDNIGYAIGYFGGRKLVVRYGRYVALDEGRLHKFESFFDRHGGKIIIVARFIEGLRQFNGLVAGTSRMRWPRFFLFNVIGAALWVAFWTGAAYLLGSRLEMMLVGFKRFELYLLLGLGLLALLFIAYFFVKGYRARSGRKP